MWFKLRFNLFNSKNVVHPLKNAIDNDSREVSEYFRNYVDKVYNEDNYQLNENLQKQKKSDNTMSIKSMSIDDNCSLITNTEPPNIILDELTQCELILYKEMIQRHTSSFTIQYRNSTYYKESVVVAMLPPLSELKYFNGKDVKMQLIVVDEFGEKSRCQEYINLHDGDFYEHHNLGKFNDNKREICEKLKAAYMAAKLR
jgi:hypothetical protein